jgi:hypothetical protein
LAWNILELSIHHWLDDNTTIMAAIPQEDTHRQSDAPVNPNKAAFSFLFPSEIHTI